MPTLIDKVAWIHLRDGRMLCARSVGKDTYYLPGGKREPGESDSETLLREIAEELSVTILPESIAYAGTFTAEAHGKAEGVSVQMTCYTADFEGELAPDSEIEEIAWLTYSDKERVSAVVQLIFDEWYEKKLLS